MILTFLCKIKFIKLAFVDIFDMHVHYIKPVSHSKILSYKFLLIAQIHASLLYCPLNDSCISCSGLLRNSFWCMTNYYEE